MQTYHIIAYNAEQDSQDVITFQASERDAHCLIYSYCSGVQARLQVAIVSGTARVIGSAGSIVRKTSLGLTNLEVFMDRAHGRTEA